MQNETTKLDTKSILYTHYFAEYILTDKYLFKLPRRRWDETLTTATRTMGLNSIAQSIGACFFVMKVVVVVFFLFSGRRQLLSFWPQLRPLSVRRSVLFQDVLCFS